MIKRAPEQCELCALMEHDAYICARWRLAYAVNRLKKEVPLLRRYAVDVMLCPFFYPASPERMEMKAADEWPQKSEGAGGQT
uniref:Uncharacterized protein n=1 Tax=Dulem virus 34 TaxID=3145752 RepID=A0AAU8B4X3_9CAUD